MSFLLLEGMEYHCIECSHRFTVNYEGGPCNLQVGESAIFRQMELNKKYGLHTGPDRPMDSILGKSQYLHEECICADCYLNKHYSAQQEAINATVISLQDVISQINSIRSEYADLYAEECARELEDLINKGDFQAIAPNIYSETIGSRMYLNADRRKKLRRHYVTKGQGEIISYIIRLYNESLNLSKIIAQYRNEVEPFVSKAIEITNSLYKISEESSLPDDVFIYYQSISVRALRNLNQYLIYDKTIGVPATLTQDTMVYYAYHLSPRHMIEKLKTRMDDVLHDRYPGSIYDSRIDKTDVLKKMSSRIEMWAASLEE